MKYSKMLKDLFPEITLNVKDLFVLSSFQIKYLPDRIHQKEFSVLLRAHPIIKDFLIIKYPEIQDFINTVLKNFQEITDQDLINEYCNELLWEIGELIIYNKYPEIFDNNCDFSWKVEEIISEKSLSGKVIADVGAGSGKLSFLMSKYVKTVFAVEPISNFRQFIRDKKHRQNTDNIFVTDGMLNSIPFPDNFFDVLMTSNAIGWDLENELTEIERVVKPKGQIIHLMRVRNKETDNPFHETLISKDWSYTYIENNDDKRIKLKYSKIND